VSHFSAIQKLSIVLDSSFILALVGCFAQGKWGGFTNQVTQ
jgi:hypothetical protein